MLHPTALDPNTLDAVIVLGGGVDAAGNPNPWVKPRLDAAVQLFQSNPRLSIICSSGGSPHKAPPIDNKGFPIFESVASVRYLENLGVPSTHVLAETASYDTLGNAFFTRIIHTDIKKMRRLHIITSEFHMQRTKVAFNLIYNLAPLTQEYNLSFSSVANIGLSASILATRRKKELQRLQQWQKLFENWQGDLGDFHALLFHWYGNYTFATLPSEDLAEAKLSY